MIFFINCSLLYGMIVSYQFCISFSWNHYFLVYIHFIFALTLESAFHYSLYKCVFFHTIQRLCFYYQLLYRIGDKYLKFDCVSTETGVWFSPKKYFILKAVSIKLVNWNLYQDICLMHIINNLFYARN